MTVEEYLMKLAARDGITVGQRLEELADAANRFAGLLQEKQIGLMSWWMMVGEVGRELGAHLKYAGISNP